MVWSNNSQDSTGTPCDGRTGVVRAPHGYLQCFSYPTGSTRVPCRTRKSAVRHPYRHIRELTQPELAKILHGRRIWPYEARKSSLRSPHRLFMGCLRYLNPKGARKLIMHALKLYRPVRGGKIRMALHGARVGPVSGRTIFVQKSPGTAPSGPRSVM